MVCRQHFFLASPRFLHTQGSGERASSTRFHKPPSLFYSILFFYIPFLAYFFLSSLLPTPFFFLFCTLFSLLFFFISFSLFLSPFFPFFFLLGMRILEAIRCQHYSPAKGVCLRPSIKGKAYCAFHACPVCARTCLCTCVSVVCFRLSTSPLFDGFRFCCRSLSQQGNNSRYR